MKTQIDYTNYVGKRTIRNILPIRMFWGKTEFHPREQWLLEAYDFEKDDPRIFAMNDIHSWNPTNG